jgi:hypothetical protein
MTPGVIFEELGKLFLRFPGEKFDGIVEFCQHLRRGGVT